MKAKKFSHRLLALFLAVVMALTCFSGALTAFAASSDSTGYHDGDIAYNSMAWASLDDEQTCTALLDYADDMLADLNFTFNYQVDIVVKKINISIDARSVDALLGTIEGFQSLLDSYAGLIGGDVNNISLKATAGMRRNNTSSTNIVKGVLKLLYQNSNDSGSNKNILKQFLTGKLNLGLVGNFLDLYSTIGNLFTPTMGTNYTNWQNNLVYNLVQNLILEYSGWFTDEEKTTVRQNSTPLDTLLFDKLSTELLAKVNVLVTYADGTNSADRYAKYLETGDSSLINSHLTYTKEGDGSNQKAGNVYLFRYDNKTIDLNETDNLFDFAYQAFEMAWNTVLADTLNQLNSNTKGYDYDYYKWYVNADGNKGTWNYSDVAANYTTASVTAWATEVCANAAANLKSGETLADQYADAATFIAYVKDELTYTRTAVEDPTYTWRDIDSTKLFNELRYSPLADYYFNMKTGPANFSFAETGLDNLKSFMANDYKNYSSMVAGINDFLVAAVSDFLPQGAHTGTYAALAKTGNTTDAKTISSTLVKNACTIVQYLADATDANILNAFYHTSGADAVLSESNLETAMVPFLISCLQNITAIKNVHPETWDACKDAEGVATVGLSEYLAYVMPDKDYSALMPKDSNGKFDVTLDGSVLPMCRDALGYVLSSIVPLYDKDGNAWDPYTSPVESSVTIFDLLNSVMVYYASDANFSNGANNSDTKGYAVGNLLGMVDASGNSLITLSNSIWKNLDTIINKLLPVVGTLQYGDASYYGKASSEDLVYNDIVKGILNIADTSVHSSGLGGVSNFLYRLLTIVSAPPISQEACIKTVYNAFADLINGIFGARYTGQTYTTVVPAQATSTHPFDDLLQVGVIAGESGNTSSIGVFGTLIFNVYQFTGGVNGEIGFKDTVLPGASFAIQAVNNFLGFIPQLSDHTLQLATANVRNAAMNSTQGGSSVATYIDIKNNCYGLNRAYGDINGKVNRLSRYSVKVKNVQCEDSTFSIAYSAGDVIAPESTLSYAVTGTAPQNPGAVRFTITYDIVDGDNNDIYTDLTSFAYMYITKDKNWKDSTYNRTDNGAYWLDNNLETDDYGKSLTSADGYAYGKSTPQFGGNLTVNYPTDIVAQTSALSELDKYQLRIRNNNAFSTKSMDGIYCYDEKSVYDDATSSNVNVNTENPIPCFDKETGDILNYKLLDYSQDNGKTWTRGVSSDDTTLVGLINSGVSVKTRVNHAYTFAEISGSGNVAAYHKDSNGVYQYIYLKTSSSLKFDALLGSISCSSGIDGIYIQAIKTSQAKKSSSYVKFLAYDGTTEITAQQKDINVRFYNSTASASGTIKISVCDDSNTATLAKKYKTVQNYLTNYRPTDFTDYDNSTEESAVYNLALQSLQYGLSAQATPITPASSITMSDQTERTMATSETKSFYGDKAYTPVSSANVDSALSSSIKAYATTKDINGTTYYFNDKECNFPYYSNVAIADSAVTAAGTITIGEGENAVTYNKGTDPVGTSVVKVDGVWYLLNSQAYNYVWDTTTYDTPYKVKDTAKDGTYDTVQYVYRDANGNKTTSSSVVAPWTTKLAAGQTTTKVNDGTDYRGSSSKAIDYLTYAIEFCNKHISTAVAQNIYDQVSTVRQGLNNVNFDVATYEKVVSLAKQAESMYQACIYKVGDADKEVLATCNWDAIEKTIAAQVKEGETVDDYSYYFTTTSSSLQIEEAIRMFNFFMDKAIERGYIGDKMEAEINCASGSNYSAMTTAWTTVDENTKNATVSTTASTCKYGAVVDGVLSNTGSTVYTAESWQNYVNALANAVDTATLGNGSYAHKTTAYYDISAKDTYDAQVSDVFTLRNDLMKAENDLTEVPVSTGYNVSGSIATMSKPDGTTLGAAAYGAYTIDVYSDAERTNLVTTATSTCDWDAKTNTFTIEGLEDGTYYATVSSTYAITREDVTIVVNGADVADAQIPVIACDYNKDGTITVIDNKLAVTAANTDDQSGVQYCDLNADGSISVIDTKLVFACAASDATYPAITIQ